MRKFLIKISIGSLQGVTVGGTTGSAGGWSYQLYDPTALIVDPYGFMYIMDYSNSRVVKWYPGDSYGRTILSGSFYNPVGLQFDRLNNLVVADMSYHRILSFSISCRKLKYIF